MKSEYELEETVMKITVFGTVLQLAILCSKCKNISRIAVSDKIAIDFAVTENVSTLSSRSAYFG